MAFQEIGGNGDGGLTQTAATLIQTLIPPRPTYFTRVIGFGYADTGTAHTLTFMRPLGKTTCVGANASGQAVVNIAADPGVAAGYGGISNAIAANDFVAIREIDGVTRFYKVSSVSTLAITLTGNLTSGTAGGEPFWFFGITTDTDGRTGKAHPKFTGGAGTTTTSFPPNSNASQAVATIGKDEPMLFNSNNATNAGTLVSWQWAYSQN